MRPHRRLSIAGRLVAAAPLALAGCSGIDAPTAPRASASVSAYVGPDPVLFVHGWNSSKAAWTTMIGRFKADGYADAQLSSWSYNTAQSNAVTAQQIGVKVDSILAATGAPRVDLVTHSMGALSTRYYLKNLGGTTKVDAWVSLGGPNHGTNTALLCNQTSCVEMRPRSRFLGALNSGDESPFGKGDATPRVRYQTWYSACDEVINPYTSTPIAGADTTRTACLKHSQLHQDATVYGQVREWVGGGVLLAAAARGTPPRSD